jgi:hypothetical protein
VFWVATAIDTFALVSLASRSYNNIRRSYSKWSTRSIKPSIAIREAVRWRS